MENNLLRKLRRNSKGEYFTVKSLDLEQIRYLNENYEKIDQNVWANKTNNFADLEFKRYDIVYIIGKGMSLDFLQENDIIPNSNVLCINESINIVKQFNNFNLYSLIFDYNLGSTIPESNNLGSNNLESKVLGSENFGSNFKIITGDGNYSWYKDSYRLHSDVFNLKLNELTAIKALYIAKYFGAKNIIFYGFDSCLSETGYDTRYADSIDFTKFKTVQQNPRFNNHKEFFEAKCTELGLKWVFALPQDYHIKIEFAYNIPIETKINIIRNGTKSLVSNFKDLDSKVFFLPYLGEAGWFFMWHVHMVNQFHASEKIVCCKENERIYFPTATEFYIHNYSNKDFDKSGTQHSFDFGILKQQFRNCDLVPSDWLNGNDEETIPDYFYKYPLELESKVLVENPFDIILGARYRERGPQRNWRHWDKIKSYLDSNKISYAILGKPETINPIFKDCIILDNDETAIHCLKNCKLYIGNDSGSSHLAALCKAPMLIFRYPSLGDRTNRMKLLNDKVKIIEGWSNPELVINNLEQILKEQ
jgi:hypothetical protein